MSNKLKKLTPQIRFLEFKNHWIKKKLSEVCNKIQDGNYGESYPKSDEFIETGIPFLTSKAISKNGQIIKSKIDYISPEKHTQLNKAHLELNDVLFTNRGANVGTIGFVDESISNGNIGPQLTLLRSNKQIILPLFLQYYMNTYAFQKQVHSQDSGSAMNFFGIGATEKFIIYIPSITEQEKIASFLGAIATRLTQLRRKHELLQTYKRSVMQKIFSQQIRFTQPDGSPFPDWEEKTVENVFDWIKTNSLSREALNYDFGTVQNIHYGDIHSKFKSQFRLKNEEVPYINDLEFISNLDDESFCKVGDLVIADASEDYADIGKTIEIIEVDHRKLVAGLHCFIARPKGNLLRVGFSGYLFQTENIRNQIRRIAQGISVLGISKSNLGSILLPYPQPLEQEKIANFLTAIDHKIEALSRQIDLTEQFKKGLLQKLFV